MVSGNELSHALGSNNYLQFAGSGDTRNEFGTDDQVVAAETQRI